MRPHPAGLLAGDGGDAVGVRVVVEDGDAGTLGSGRDQEVGLTHLAVVQAPCRAISWLTSSARSQTGSSTGTNG